MIQKTIIHLLSGGLDSATMLWDLRQQGHSVHCLLFDYGQPHLKELVFARQNCLRANVEWTEKRIPPLNGLTDLDWVVPNRNAILLSVAVNVAVQAKADTVTIGCNADDAENFPDCRKEFIEAMNSAVRAAGYSVEICAPYLGRTKGYIKRLASDMGLTLEHIWTCYRGGVKPCGDCPACKKLEAASE